MTVIAAAIGHDGLIAIGSDTISAWGHGGVSVFGPKIVPWGRFMVGLSGAGYLTREIQRVPSRVDDAKDGTDVAAALREIATSHNFLPNGHDGGPANFDLSGIIVDPERRGVFMMSGDFCADPLTPTRKGFAFWAVGSGCLVALGAMDAAFSSLNYPPAGQVVRLGVEAAMRIMPGTCGGEAIITVH